MQKTRYTNSHGLADPNNKSCAYDLALLCDRAMSNPLFREIVKAKDFQTEVMIDFSDLNEGKIDQQNPLSFLKVGNKVIKGNLSSELSVNLINIKGCVTNESDVNRCSLKQEYRTVCWYCLNNVGRIPISWYSRSRTCTQGSKQEPHRLQDLV